MSDNAQVLGSFGFESQGKNPPSEPCIMVIFGASGDLTKRLLVPALYNLHCDGLLAKNFAVLGTKVCAPFTLARNLMKKPATNWSAASIIFPVIWMIRCIMPT